MFQKKLLALLLFISLIQLNVLAQTHSNSIICPLPADSKTVTRNIEPNFTLEVSPIGDGWIISVTTPVGDEKGYNLLYHSKEWHGPYPTDVYAWHVDQNFFPETRWLCVRGYPIEVKVEIENAKTRRLSDDDFEFTQGRLIVSWYHRPCTQGL